jgi:formylglycine-generating enzyme required for sulfatase activity
MAAGSCSKRYRRYAQGSIPFAFAVSTSYNPYPFADGFNGWPACESPAGTTTHSANCDRVVDDTTDVGAYTTSPSDYGTFDQGGNVWEWNEAIMLPPGQSTSRGLRGGWHGSSAHGFGGYLAKTYRGSLEPEAEHDSSIGFRVAMIPEPGTGLLVMAGLLGLAGWRRSHV